MTTKLLIRHLPSFFTPEDTKSFLRSFGSIDVHTFDAKGKMVSPEQFFELEDRSKEKNFE